MFKASNLGQIIGRALYGELDGASPATAAPAVARAPYKRIVRGGRAKDIADVLARHPEGLRVRTIAALARIGNVNIVNAYLCQMPDVEKSGARGSYLYKLKSAP
jgi:hypothetical protein